MQLDYYTRYVARASKPPYSNQTTVHGSVHFPPPGSWNSTDRFTRLAMLRRAAALSDWHGRQPISPNFVGLGVPDTNPTLITTIGMLNTVVLPKGAFVSRV